MNSTTIPASTPPAPAAGSATGTEARVCADIANRQQRGIEKYGYTVEGNPLHLISWLRHAYEECLDQAVYLRRAIEEIERPNDKLRDGATEMRPSSQET